MWVSDRLVWSVEWSVCGVVLVEFMVGYFIHMNTVIYLILCMSIKFVCLCRNLRYKGKGLDKSPGDVMT